MMKKRWICFAAIILLVTMVFAQTGALKSGEELPAPTHADVAYGPDSMNVMDLWLVPSETPTPLLVFIHGGGFRGGDKRKFSSELIKKMQSEGISVASINYRLTEEGLFAEGENMYPAPMYDGARALQFLRYNASQYNLDKTKFAATGGSAGGCMLMWLGFHPDLAQADHTDPVLRESSRLQVLAPRGGQTSVHGPTLLKWFEVNSLNLSRRKGIIQSSSERIPTAKQFALSLDASPITHLTPDDPPIYLLYNSPNDAVDEKTLWGTWVHHPMLGIKLKEAMDELGMECYLQYTGGPSVTAYESQQDFVIRKLKSLPEDTTRGKLQADVAMKWKTSGFRQANSMGGREAAISKSGKFRVFLLMGQSNMQGAADGTRKDLAEAYYDRFNQLISDLRTDLGTPDLPVFVPVYANDEDLLKIILSSMTEEDLLKAVMSYLYDKDPSELRKSIGKRLYFAKVLMAQNRAGREIPNVITLYPGKLPTGEDGVHFSSEGYIMLGKITASSVEEYHKAKE
ncbi:MAG: hypothetical protein DRI97_14420 [Bacteroidetes bacterium]|nr:MAG: hypothetical protein DRI97_14420 [Bacteroidota bacterium]RLD91785.1 MAG: hypothetical protein DRJ29_13615 [Bacteroidota bacterium]